MCALGRCLACTGRRRAGAGEARVRRQRVEGGVARVLAVGAGSGGRWSDQGGPGHGAHARCSMPGRRPERQRFWDRVRERELRLARGGLAWVQGERRTLVEARGGLGEREGTRERERVGGGMAIGALLPGVDDHHDH